MVQHVPPTGPVPSVVVVVIVAPSAPVPAPDSAAAGPARPAGPVGPAGPDVNSAIPAALSPARRDQSELVGVMLALAAGVALASVGLASVGQLATAVWGGVFIVAIDGVLRGSRAR